LQPQDSENKAAEKSYVCLNFDWYNYALELSGEYYRKRVISYWLMVMFSKPCSTICIFNLQSTPWCPN